MHILSDISRSKGDETIKFRQLIEYMRNIFYEKSCARCGGEPSPRLFFKKSNLSIYLDQHFEVSHSLLVSLYVQVENYQNIETKGQSNCFYFI